MRNRNTNKMLVIPIIAGLLIVCTIMGLSACGNKAILDPGTFNFKHVHISDNVEGHCLNIDKWWDNESGIEVRTTSGNGVFCSEGTYQMFESADSCPYCH